MSGTVHAWGHRGSLASDPFLALVSATVTMVFVLAER